MQLSRWRLVVLPTTLLGLMCLLGAEPPRTLRYGGKTMDEWKIEARTDLKPEVQVECIKALVALGQSGRATEAVEVILELVGQYEPDDKDGEPVYEAAMRLSKLGRPIVPQLIEALGSEKKAVRGLARLVLNADPLGEAATKAIQEGLAAEKPHLLRLARGDNQEQASAAVTILLHLDTNAPELSPLIFELLASEKAYMRCVGVRTIGWKPRIDVKKVTPILIRLLEDEDKDVRTYAVVVLQDTDLPKEVVPVLCKLMQPDQIDSSYEEWLFTILGKIGPAAKEAVPALTERWVRQKRDQKQFPYDAFRKAFTQIDPAEAKRVLDEGKP